MAGNDHKLEIEDEAQRQTLIVLFVINGIMFFSELALGIYADSSALIADSLDMLADALVYGVGIYAVGRATAIKVRTATLSGTTQIVLGLTMLAEVGRRLIYGSEPVSLLMMSVGTVALVANLWCLFILAKHRHGEVHMRASWIFSSNDVIANIGVIVAGILVLLMGARWPDLAIGSIISAVVINGGIRILREAAEEQKQYT